MIQRLSWSNNKPPTSRDHYLVTFQEYPDDLVTPNIWRHYSPPKCKFFLWLLHRDRLRTKAMLFHCHMQSDRACPFCTSDEDCFHLFIDCSCSKSFWSFIGLDLSSLHDAMGDGRLTLSRKTIVELVVRLLLVFFGISRNKKCKSVPASGWRKSSDIKKL